MAKMKFFKQSVGMKVTYILFLLFFFLEAVFHVFPMVWAVMNSLKSAKDFFNSNFGLPTSLHFNNYIHVFSDFRYKQFTYLDMLFNSLWILAVKVFVNVLSSTLMAYALARFRFPGKNFLYSLVIFANTIPIIGAGSVEYKFFSELGFVNNPALIWFAWAGGFDFAFIVLYGTFKGISQNYSEAARIDGAGNLRVLLQIVLPQAFPCIAAIAITQAIGVWNNYGTVMIYLRDFPNLAYGLYLFETGSNYVENSKPIFFAATVISSIPVIVLYASNMKLILTNVTAGGLKG